MTDADGTNTGRTRATWGRKNGVLEHTDLVTAFIGGPSISDSGECEIKVAATVLATSLSRRPYSGGTGEVLGPRGSATFISHLPVGRVRGVKCVQWPLAPSKKHRMDPPRIPARTLQGSTGRSDSPMLGESERSMDPSRVLVGTLGGFKRRPLEGASGHLTFADS